MPPPQPLAALLYFPPPNHLTPVPASLATNMPPRNVSSMRCYLSAQSCLWPRISVEWLLTTGRRPGPCLEPTRPSLLQGTLRLEVHRRPNPSPGPLLHPMPGFFGNGGSGTERALGVDCAPSYSCFPGGGLVHDMPRLAWRRSVSNRGAPGMGRPIQTSRLLRFPTR